MGFGRFIRSIAARTALLGLLTLGLSACPQTKAPGSLGFGIYATNTERCDDGLKVEVEFNTSGLSDGPAPSVPEDENVYGGGANWLWVKPGKVGWMRWMDDPYDRVVPGGTLRITAWCMRVGDDPGKSNRSFSLGDYIEPSGVIATDLMVRDMSTDPDTASYPGYTEVITPAPSIFDWGEWCNLGVPGDCSDIE